MKQPFFSCFIAGTDTEIGKTLISSAILHALCDTGARAVGMKPVAAGATLEAGVWHNDDVDSLRAASNVAVPAQLRNPYLLQEPCAPQIAARRQQIEIEAAPILAAYRALAAQAEAVVVEGVGGFCVPLSDSFDTADMAQQLALPVVLVVGMRLGCQSHALLTAEAIAARGLTLAGWVANTVDAGMAHLEQNVAALAARIRAPLLGQVPRLSEPSAARAAACLNLHSLPGWPAGDHRTTD
jgi:dethiobiotin synthetase